MSLPFTDPAPHSDQATFLHFSFNRFLCRATALTIQLQNISQILSGALEQLLQLKSLLIKHEWMQKNGYPTDHTIATKGLCAKWLCGLAVWVIFNCGIARTVQISHKQAPKSMLVYAANLSITTQFICLIRHMRLK